MTEAPLNSNWKQYQQTPRTYIPRTHLEQKAKDSEMDITKYSITHMQLLPILGPAAHCLMITLVDEECLRSSLGQLQPDGSFYITQRRLEQKGHGAPSTQLRNLKKLEELGLITRLYRNIQNENGNIEQIRYIKINRENFINLIKSAL